MMGSMESTDVMPTDTATTSPSRPFARAADPPALTGDDSARHAHAMWWSAELREWWRRMWKPGAQRVEPHDVVTVLNAAKVDFILMGAHAIAGWLADARSTQDVDVLVAHEDHEIAVEAIRLGFPELQMRETTVVTRFIDPATDKIVIDLMKPLADIHQLVFKNAVEVGKTHRIPDLEMALATKFAAMVSPIRERQRKRQDAVDFGSIVLQHQKEIDRDKLREFGETVYPGGGDEIILIMNNIIEDKPITL